jgi:glucose/arabinose dehydrogenase
MRSSHLSVPSFSGSTAVIAMVLVSSLIAPLAYGQEFLPLTKWGKYGIDNGHFKSPTDISVSSQQPGNILVTDTGNNRIQVFSSNGTFIAKWGKYGSDKGNFKSPSSVAVGFAGNVYVADTGNNRIQVFTDNGTFIAKWGRYGTSNGNFKSPSSVAVGSAGNVYVADTGNNRIQIFSSNGTFIAKWGKYGTDNGTFNQPHGIAVTPQTENMPDDILVADTGNNRIQMFSSNGTFIAKWGKYGTADASFKQPRGIAVNQPGNIFVSDTGNNRFLVFDMEYVTNINFSDVDGNISIKDSNLHARIIAEDLDFPTSLAFLGPSDILVLERMTGTVKRILDGKLLEKPLLNLSDYKIRSCMCGIAVAKEGSATYVFLHIAELEDNNNNTSDRLYRYELVNDTVLANPKVLLEMPIHDLRSEHHGGKMVIGQDNNLYLTVGDIYGYQTKAQNVKDGSDPDGSSAVLRLTLDGKAVNGSSILGSSDPLNKYYAYGIRNSFGIDIDPLTEKIWITDNGPDHGDEINLVEPGFNGGWKEVMGMASSENEFNPDRLVDFDRKGKYADPQFEWGEPIGPTAIKFLNSTELGPEYYSDMFVGDVNTGNLYRFELNQTRTGLSLNGSLSDKVANNIQERDRTVFASGFGGITDIQVGPDGYLYVVSIPGKIYAIAPSTART